MTPMEQKKIFDVAKKTFEQHAESINGLSLVIEALIETHPDKEALKAALERRSEIRGMPMGTRKVVKTTLAFLGRVTTPPED